MTFREQAISRHILKRVLFELTGVYSPGSLRESGTLTYDPAGSTILVTHPDGSIVELTARTLSADDPAAARIAESIRAIEAGDVE